MARIEKTVFISYRRKDISWALAVYQYLTSQKYDVFFDYTSIPSGDFEQIIVSNIRARAHFVLILTSTALDRCSNPGDWLRREIETAIDEKRNIIPLFFDGFNFGSPTVTEKLTGKLSTLNRYNGLDIPSGYFMEAMERLRNRYLNIPLDAVIHPVPTEVRRKVQEEKVAANKALREQKEDIQELVKAAQEKIEKQKGSPDKESSVFPSLWWKVVVKRISSWFKKINPRPYGIGMGVFLIVAIGILSFNSLIQNPGEGRTLIPSQTREAGIESTITPTRLISTGTSTLTLTLTESTPSITPTVTYTHTSVPPLIGKEGMTLLYVPAGEFTMGSKNGDDDEKPVHTVYLDAFWIDQTEVTNAMYAMCVEAGECDPPDSTTSFNRDSNRYFGNAEFDDYPVIFVSWNDANTYCMWADRRLPTESEWEKAARGTDGRTYPWGEELDETYAKYNSVNITPVGSYEKGKSAYGAYDMAGNVWEWVADWYDKNYFAGSPFANPSGPDGGKSRVVKGGSYSFGDYLYIGGIRSADRYAADPTKSLYSLGFRCAMSASE